MGPNGCRGESWQDEAQRRGGRQRKIGSQCRELVDGDFDEFRTTVVGILLREIPCGMGAGKVFFLFSFLMGFAGQRKSGVEFVGCVGDGDR